MKICRKQIKAGTKKRTIRSPRIMKVKYTVDGQEYTKRVWIKAGLPVPDVGSAVQVLFDSDKPSKAKVM